MTWELGGNGSWVSWARARRMGRRRGGFRRTSRAFACSQGEDGSDPETIFFRTQRYDKIHRTKPKCAS
jgi:hypothetical protein